MIMKMLDASILQLVQVIAADVYTYWHPETPRAWM